MTIFLSREAVKGIGVTKSIVFNEFVMTLVASTRVFHKKVNQFSIFVIFYFLFVYVRYILYNCRSQGLHLEEQRNLFMFSFLINAFGNIFFFENKYYLILLFSFLSICYLVSLMRAHIIHYRCLQKMQSNIFWGPKYGFAASKAFSVKF